MKTKVLLSALLLAAAGATWASSPSEVDNVGHHTTTHNTAELKGNQSDTVARDSAGAKGSADIGDAATRDLDVSSEELYLEYNSYNDDMFF